MRVQLRERIVDVVGGYYAVPRDADVYVYLAGTTTQVQIYREQTGALTATQPLTVVGGRVVARDAPSQPVWVDGADALDLVGTAVDPSGYTLPFGPVRVNAAEVAASVTERESARIDAAMNYEPRLFNTIDLTFYGAPNRAQFRWPDGSTGSFILNSSSTFNFVDKVDAYTITYRAEPDTSATDNMAWRPREGFAVLADATAAERVTRSPEVRAENTVRNAYVPSAAELATVLTHQWNRADQNPYIPLVTGRSGLTNPSTDELIQWASHKWGIPTDWMRAQMHLESVWSMDALGDLTTVPSGDYTLYPDFSRHPNGTQVYQSVGISQERWSPDNELGPGSDPLRWKSTAFNLDYYASWVRFYFDDPGGARTLWGDVSYVPGDQWLALGGWFQPYPYGNSGQLNYISLVQQRLASKPWRVAEFTNVPGAVATYLQPAITRSQGGFVLTRPPIVKGSLTAPGQARNLTATPGHTVVTLDWDPPLVDGGTPLTGYRIIEVNVGWHVDTGFTTAGPYTLTGLTNGQSYTFAVAAIGPGGVGAYSSSVTSTPVSASVPGAPTGVTGSPGNATASLSWTAPASNGGAAITAYRITPYIGATAQTPVTTPSASTGYVVTGLTNDTAYTFRVAAINDAGTGANSTASSAITPTQPVMPHPANMPIISRGLPATSTQPGGVNSDQLPAAALNNIRGDVWHSITTPTPSAPHRLTIDLRSLTTAQRSSVWAVLSNQGAPGTAAPGTTNVPWYGMPSHYKLWGHPTSGAEPAAGDSGWVQIADVSLPSSVCSITTGASNGGLDLSGYGYLAVQVLDVFVSGSETFFNFDLRDVRNGHDDAIMFYGDSWIFEGVRNVNLDNGPWRTGAIEGLIEAAAPTRNWPIIQPGGTGGWTAQAGDDNKETFVGPSKCKIVVVALGANDANGAGIDLNDPGVQPNGINSNFAQTYKTRMQSIVDYCVSLGKFVVIPYVNYQTLTTWAYPNSLILNTIIDQIIAANPGTTALGADIFGFFALHPELLRVGAAGDQHLHPSVDVNDATHQYQSKTGYEWYHTIWANWIVANLYS